MHRSGLRRVARRELSATAVERGAIWSSPLPDGAPGSRQSPQRSYPRFRASRTRREKAPVSRLSRCWRRNPSRVGQFKRNLSLDHRVHEAQPLLTRSQTRRARYGAPVGGSWSLQSSVGGRRRLLFSKSPNSSTSRASISSALCRPRFSRRPFRGRATEEFPAVGRLNRATVLPVVHGGHNRHHEGRIETGVSALKS